MPIFSTSAPPARHSSYGQSGCVYYVLRRIENETRLDICSNCSSGIRRDHSVEDCVDRCCWLRRQELRSTAVTGTSVHCHHWAGGEAARTAVCRGLRFDVGASTITTPRASACTSSQTFDWSFRRRKWFAHPCLLLDLMWTHHISLSGRISRNRCLHAGWRWTPVSRYASIWETIIRRRWTPYVSASWTKRISRRTAGSPAGRWIWSTTVAS